MLLSLKFVKNFGSPSGLLFLLIPKRPSVYLRTTIGIYDSHFSSNIVRDAGIIYVRNEQPLIIANFSIFNSTFRNNIASYAAALFINSSLKTIKGYEYTPLIFVKIIASHFELNVAKHHTSAVFIKNVFDLNIENSTFINNIVLRPEKIKAILVTCILGHIRLNKVRVYSKFNPNHKIMEFMLSSLQVPIKGFETSIVVSIHLSIMELPKCGLLLQQEKASKYCYKMSNLSCYTLLSISGSLFI